MGFFDFFKANKKGSSQRRSSFEALAPISNDEYQKKRQKEIEWLEVHYDLGSVGGIQSIPERSDLPRPTFGDGGGFRSYTGDIDYYLRKKSAECEDSGNIELAILCLRKSNAIRMVSRRGYRKDDYYALVRLLARSGYVKEATAEKAKIDSFFGDADTDLVQLNGRGQAHLIIKSAYELDTRLLLMNAHGSACPECAKYQGRVFSIYGKDPRFPPLPESFYEFGAIHKGCCHQFSAYIHECSDPMLDHTLQFYKGLKRKYRKNIIAFSNRPFIDDRTQEDIDEANRIIEEHRIAVEKKKHAEEHMIETEAMRGTTKREYQWVLDNLPDICPKSLSGFQRMKKQNTKNYQKIVAEAKKHGFHMK